MNDDSNCGIEIVFTNGRHRKWVRGGFCCFLGGFGFGPGWLLLLLLDMMVKDDRYLFLVFSL